MNTDNETRPLRLLKLSDVQQRVAMGKTTIYAKIKDGRFPRPVSLSPGMVRWREADVDQWIATLATTDGLAA